MKILTLSIICLAAMGVSNANAAPRTPGAALDKADANHDGYVTRDELKVSRGAQFERLDRNHDGVVTLSEFPRLAKSNRPKARTLKTLITHADRDGDGQVTRAEFVDGQAPLFDRADRDHDERLSRDELTAVREQLKSLK
ncbi:EF-hand domain-containing protein [Caulobacter sp. 1776]|uniref:EF-hand domain-containing protein n=1 Tax=Caulobacter sp. 1776 TaxID=3156420 RepID=UPI0033984813